MTQSRSSIGFLGMFGRSSDLRQLDQAFRTVDVHPRLVPEPVKLTIVKLLKADARSSEPPPTAYAAAAEIVGYCILGADLFADANTEALCETVKRRIETALEAQGGLDADLLVLALHAKIIQPSVIERYGLEITLE